MVQYHIYSTVHHKFCVMQSGPFWDTQAIFDPFFISISSILFNPNSIQTALAIWVTFSHLINSLSFL